jgi:hypothetical protein
MTVRRERLSQGRASITRPGVFATSTRGTYYLEDLDADSRTGYVASRRYVPGEQP